METEQILFSIVVPVYNVEQYLEDCITSITGQIDDTLKNCVEILLIDDGSTDQSGRLCDRFKERYPFLIRVVHKENEGLLATRRRGYKLAKGMYIVNCDSDDMLEAGALTKLRQCIRQEKEPDVILYNYQVYDGEKKAVEFEHIFSTEASCRIKKEAVLREFLYSRSIISLCCKAYKRECLDQNRDVSLYGCLSTGEDTLQSVEIFDRASSFVYLDEALYNYRVGSGMTNRFDPHFYSTFRKIFADSMKTIKHWEFSEKEQALSCKVLSTAGRSITQSRFFEWSSAKEHKAYLKKIQNDSFFQSYHRYLFSVRMRLQTDYVVLDFLLARGWLTMIVWLLRIKNRTEHKKGTDRNKERDISDGK